MHARRTARDAFLSSHEDDGFFAPRRGDIVLRTHAAARVFADRLNRRPGAKQTLQASELAALSLLHEMMHAVIERYRVRFPDSFTRLMKVLDAAMGEQAKVVLVDFVAAFPPPIVYRGFKRENDYTPARWLERAGPDIRTEIDEELLLLWVTSQNEAYAPIADVVGDAGLGLRYRTFIGAARQFFETEPAFGPNGETLLELLLEPGGHGSIWEQLDWVDQEWTETLGMSDHPSFQKRGGVEDLKKDEGRWFTKGGPGPGEPLLEAMRFGRKGEEKAQFSPDLNWMPQVVLIAKSVYVWLDQLSKKYEREIRRLDQIPDEELDILRARGITGLWLIGLFERSNASRRVKQMRGDTEALASAYSLYGYDIAHELGGVPAWRNLRDRAWVRGVRLAADMVPNHVGVDGQWVMNHPDWFLQAKRPPYPNYRYGGPDLSSDPRASVQIEDGYWSMTDAAVTFRRVDRHTGEERFIYHGNDGTSMPWNDTAQLDYTNPEVRRAVIETILHVAGMFPIIRFDAAMTLAKKHVQRLWFPLPGQGAGAIPSRADYSMTEEEFDAAIPIEFWREVVDTCAQRAPDTLLLAEAFWMMEGYFVRTLGMHRVYNSAFMNMLKREENQKYRETITNVLDFDPEILKRFVNFMNNPDEDTAISQFGDGDKYFGVCAMMATLPGLPMIGHGQIEGFREKYGMEYARAKFDEWINGHLVARHEKEIFPLLHRRWMFSGVDHFAIYDFDVGGVVDEDVFAYSNGAGAARALVIFHNRQKMTRGLIKRSTHREHLANELGVDPTAGEWLVVRDVPHGLEYLYSVADLVVNGIPWQLGPYEYHVLSDFRQVEASLDLPYDRLALELNGEGVPDVDFAARELYLRPLHAPLREACGKGHTGYLAAQLDAPDDAAARASIEEKLGHFADGLEWMLSRRAGRDVTLDRAAALQAAGDRFAKLHAFARAKVPPDDQALPASERAATVMHVDMLLAAIHVEAAIELLAEADRAVAIAMYLPAPLPLPIRPDPSRPKFPISSRRLLDSSRKLLESQPALEEPAIVDEVPPASASAAETLPDLEAERSAPELPAEVEPIAEAASVTAAAVGAGALSNEASTAVGAVEPTEAAAETSAAVGAVEPPEAAAEASTAVGAVEPPEAAAEASAAVGAPHAEATSESKKPSSPAALQAPVPPSSATREGLIAEWQLANPVVAGFATIAGEDEARRRAAIVILGATLPSSSLASSLRLALGTKRGRQLMNVHEANGVFWLTQERYEELARFLGEREAANGSLTPAEADARLQEVVDVAVREGFKAQEIAWSLDAVIAAGR
ncbi:MAG: hypothetical protein KIT84_07650 [Labilithrix sp.]|nr:hypothetical protein [Labilithrix sp.]MCW5810870.1 hypothetical protein [Labilithrix sp.]